MCGSARRSSLLAEHIPVTGKRSRLSAPLYPAPSLSFASNALFERLLWVTRVPFPGAAPFVLCDPPFPLLPLLPLFPLFPLFNALFPLFCFLQKKRVASQGHPSDLRLAPRSLALGSCAPVTGATTWRTPERHAGSGARVLIGSGWML